MAVELDASSNLGLNHAARVDILGTDAEVCLCCRATVHIFHTCRYPGSADFYRGCNYPYLSQYGLWKIPEQQG